MKTKLFLLFLGLSLCAFTPWRPTRRIIAVNTSKSDTLTTSTGGLFLTVKGKQGMYVTVSAPPCTASVSATDTVLYHSFPILAGQTTYLGIPSLTCVAAISMDSTTDTLFITQGK